MPSGSSPTRSNVSTCMLRRALFLLGSQTSSMSPESTFCTRQEPNLKCSTMSPAPGSAKPSVPELPPEASPVPETRMGDSVSGSAGAASRETGPCRSGAPAVSVSRCAAEDVDGLEAVQRRSIPGESGSLASRPALIEQQLQLAIHAPLLVDYDFSL